VFAWQPPDMTGVPRDLYEHRLNVYPSKKPIQQKQRKMNAERNEVIKVEVQKLVEGGILEKCTIRHGLRIQCL
jgi:hypothetical protein